MAGGSSTPNGSSHRMIRTSRCPTTSHGAIPPRVPRNRYRPPRRKPQMPDDQLPAVRTPELERFRQLGQWLALSESGGDSANARSASAALRLFYAQELALPPLAAAELSVIRGKLVVSARLLRALAGRHGYRVVKVKSTPEGCMAAPVN